MKVAIIGSQTLGTPTEIYAALHGDHRVTIIENESQNRILKIENTAIYAEPVFTRPLTRKERRKLARKK